SAGEYPAAEARRAAGQELPVRVVPPGVDADRFRPPTAAQRRAARLRLGVPERAPLVVSVSRLVPRKGMDVLIRAAASLRSLHPDLQVLISGAGRDRRRLQHLVEAERAPVRLLGRIADDDLVALYGAADVFAMLCRTRWGGLEQEGFGIVFLEAAACGVAQICGASGGAAEAVAHGESGLVVDAPGDVRAVEAALQRLLGDEELRARMGRAARARVEAEFSYDRLARTLGAALHERAPF
ncbi:MAG: glycosyltransferase family 4 protein, partial [Acidimicrobiales bacterium]